MVRFTYDNAVPPGLRHYDHDQVACAESLQQTGRRRLRHERAGAALAVKTGRFAMDRVERFFMVLTLVGMVGTAVSIAWIMLI